MARKSNPFIAGLEKRCKEAVTALSQNDVRRQLADQIEDIAGMYCYLCDVFGDDESGEVIYSSGGGLMKAPYTLAMVDGKRSTSIDTKAAVNVLPRTIYDEEADAMTESSFDWASGFPQPARVTEKEISAFVPLREGAVGQDGTAFLKLIAPGWGSSGYYSQEVLKRDGPKIFKNGTKNFWNHQTATEEAERPEGDLRDLASVLTEDAHYEDKGPAGPGLYAKASVFPAYREHVDALAKNIGVSIRAYGSAKEGTAEGRKGPIIEKLTRGQSVDYVTSPGAGGQVLQLFEAARAAAHQPKESKDMEQAEVQKLVESAINAAVNPLKAENRKLLERLTLATEAPTIINEALAAVNLPVATKDRLRARLIGSAPLTEAGAIDKVAFKALIEAEIKDEGEYLSKLSEGRIVQGMGPAPVIETDPVKAQEAENKAYEESMAEVADIFVRGDKAKKLFVAGRAA